MTFRLRTDDGASLTVVGDRVGRGESPAGAVFDLGRGTLVPGLINAHDHLTFNHYPRLGSPPYGNVYQWVEDVRANWAEAIDRSLALPTHEALLFGALKNLLGGVTTVVHHDPWHDLFADGFPIRVARTRIVHSLGLERDLDRAVHGDADTAGLPLNMHLAEGTDAAAGLEVREAARRELLNARFVGVHLVGIDDEGVQLFRAAGAAAVWCPTSNEYLYGRTMPRALADTGVDVVLGTDSLLTGEGTLLAELRRARALGYLDDGRLARAVGATAARRFALPAPRLAPGDPADAVLLRKPLLEATPRDVGLVLVGGRPRLGDVEFADLFTDAAVPVQPLRIGGTEKLVVAPLASIAERVFELVPECGRIFEEGAAGGDTRR